MTAKDFLVRYRHTPRDIPAEICLAALERSAEAGLRGEEGLPMVPSYLTGSSELPQEGCCAVMDAGGTNLRTALARFKDGNIFLEDIRTVPMPASSGETLTRQELYGKIAEELSRLEATGRVGCCFSYLVDIERTLDGKLREWCKEIRCPEAVGAYVGRSIREFLPGCAHITVLNDSTAALLGALRPEDELTPIGLILGTGINICYSEKRERIPKLETGLSCGSMIISTEAGEFKGFPISEFERKVIDRTDDPQSGQAEKQCSGAYLGSVIREALLQAHREGLITLSPESFTLEDVSRLLFCPETQFAGLKSEADLLFARELCRTAVHRAAKISAVLTACFLLRACPPGKTAPIAAEGSLIWKMEGFRELFCRELENTVSPHNVRFTLRQTEHSCLKGAALASFANCL